MAAGWSVISIAAGIVGVLIWQSWPILQQAHEFFTLGEFNVSKQKFGAWAYIWGTLVTSFIAMLIAVPLGIGAAAYLAEIAPGGIRRAGSFLIELLAAIPSVVYGFWGLFFLVPLVQWFFLLIGAPNTSGAGILSAGLILAIMILPYITAITFDVCRAVPRSQREGALALGATRWQMIRTVVLPYARPGIIAACFLALGRALGETMAVTMLIGNSASLPASMKDVLAVPFALGDSIASVIANQLNETTDELHRSALVGLGLVLLLVTIFVNVLARFLISRMGRPSRRHSRPLMSRIFFRSPGSNGKPETHGDPVSLPTSSADIMSAHARGIRNDRLMTGVLLSCVIVVVIPLFLILGYITYRGVGALSIEFFTERPTPPGIPGGGMAHAIGGSFLLVGLATLFAVPSGILAAVFLAEFKATRLTSAVRFIAELLGGVPSIVIGIFAYAVVVRTTGSFSGWAGAFALAVMMIPIVVRSTEESLKLVPKSLRTASLALGASHRQTVWLITLPAALPAIITGVFLAIGRIAGETAPLLLTAYGSNFWPRSPNDRTPFLPKYIYNYSTSGYPDWERQAWGAAFVLVAVVMFLNVGIRFMAGRRVVAASRAD
ncbi:MAG: phosphate ABC transporter permease PstA [Planctomycetes bacterium]|nr:phosphate ABC transporter permease PstA [Planctomycetota bacterium]